MTAERYFTLTTSNSQLSKRFRVALTNFNRPKQKKGNIKTTLDGQIDADRGGIYQTYSWILMVRETEPESEYGSSHDLDTFFMLNNPNGTPSDILTMVTHEGETLQVLITDTIDMVPVAIMIEGEDAWFYPLVKFQVLNEVIIS